MAITNKEKGVWGLDQVYNKINQGSIWEYTAPVQLYAVGGDNGYGALGLNQNEIRYSSPVQLPGTWATDRETIVARDHYGAWSMQE